MRKQNIQTAVINRNHILINIILTSLLAAVALVYIFASNYLVGQRYALRVERVGLVEAVADAAEQNHTLNELMAYAKANNMSEIIGSESVFVSSGVALNSAR